MRIAKASPDDDIWRAVHMLIAEAFADMETEAGLRPPVLNLGPEDLRKDAEDQLVLIAWDGDKIVGCLFARPSRDFPKALYLGRLAVDASQRGKGVARLLVEQAAQEAEDTGFGQLVLDTGAALQTLHKIFERMGFKIVPNPDPQPGVISMSRVLAPSCDGPEHPD